MRRRNTPVEESQPIDAKPGDIIRMVSQHRLFSTLNTDNSLGAGEIIESAIVDDSLAVVVAVKQITFNGEPAHHFLVLANGYVGWMWGMTTKCELV